VTALLEARGLIKRFGGLRAVGGEEGLSFAVGAGELVGLIGPNGAGKSTTFNLISGALAPDAGQVLFRGEDITGARPESVAGRGIARTYQTPRAFESLSVLDNVVLGADSAGERLRHAFSSGWRAEEERARAYAVEQLARVGLSDRLHQRVSDLSGGELRMLEVARQLVRDPKLLLLDEPTAGVDPALQEALAGILVELRRGGMTLLVVEHNLRFLLRLADTVLVLTDGELLARGSPAEIQSDARVVRAYLGDEHAA